MNKQRRVDLLAAIADLSQRYPDWRFGQLVSNVAGWADQGIWDVEDEQLFQAARSHLKQLAPIQPRSVGKSSKSKVKSQRSAS